MGKGEAQKYFPTSPAENQSLALLSLRTCIMPCPKTVRHRHSPKYLSWHHRLSCLIWNMERSVLWGTGQRGKGPHAHTHHLHFIQEVNAVKGWFWEDDHPAYYWKSSHADPWQWRADCRCRFPLLQTPSVPGPCHAQVCPSQLPSLGSAQECRWIWNSETSLSQVFSPPAGDALSDRLKKYKDVPIIPLYFADCKITL